MYHASPTSNVACDGTRRTFVQQISFDSDGEPVYSSSQVSEQLSRRELESMGIYEEEEPYEYESEDES